MPHETALIATLAAGFGLAFALGLLASRLKLTPVIGYLLAGVAVGPFTPGFVADAGLAAQLAEIGVMLLMFGVGLHFSIADLLACKRIAVPGAVVQIVAATLMGAGVSHLWGWSWHTGLVFGLSLSVASTVVLLRSLEDRGIVRSNEGRIAVGWLIVEDLVTVLALVILPVVGSALGTPAPAADTTVADAVAHVPAVQGNVFSLLGITLSKVALFIGLMLFVGRRVVPWLLTRVVGTGSRELFTLAVLATAFGIAVGAAAFFDVSFALGAFFAGIIVSESDFSHEAATNALPLQDAFAVLFFVSVGMLFDPAILLRMPLEVLAVVAIILVGKSIAAASIVLAFRYPVRTALTISASLAQIGEFSFILATLAFTLGLLPQETQSLIVAGSLLSITLNPIAFAGIGPAERWLRARPHLLARLERSGGELAELPTTVDEPSLRDHAIIIGYGRVGTPVAEELGHHGVPYIVIEASRERAQALRERQIPVIVGDATNAEVLGAAHLEAARLLVVAAPDAYQGRAILDVARRINPNIEIVARTHSDEERDFLEHHGARTALVAERELAVSLTRHALRFFEVDHDMAAVASRQVGTASGRRGARASKAAREPDGRH